MYGGPIGRTMCRLPYDDVHATIDDVDAPIDNVNVMIGSVMKYDVITVATPWVLHCTIV